MGTKKVNRPDEAVLNKLLDKHKGRVEEAVIRLAWQAGLTRQEIYELEWSNISWEENMIQLPKKSVPMADELRHCLETRRILFPPAQYPYVVTADSNSNHPSKDSFYRIAVKTMNEESALEGIGLNDLRSDFLIRILEQGGRAKAVREGGISIESLYVAYADYMPSAKGEVKKMNPADAQLDEERLLALLRSEGSSLTAIVLWLIWELGMTLGEITSLTWDQIDFDANVITLPEKEYVMTPPVSQVLKDAFTKRIAGEQTQLVLPTGVNKPYVVERVVNIIRGKLIRAGLEDLHLLTLAQMAKDKAINEKIFAFIREHGSIKNQQSEKLLGLCNTVIHKRMCRLVKQGKLIKKGPRYYLAEE